ncbi:MAG: lipid-A-disaccharide synthase N-terminal domain-containing protein [Alphaproteobacteria bacterium]
MTDTLAQFLDWFSAHWDWWVGFGLLGQGLFAARFLYQWIASERARQSVVPEGFWYLSLAGGFITLLYAIHKEDIVFIIGQSTGTLVYLRNLHFIRRAKHDARAAAAPQ